MQGTACPSDAIRAGSSGMPANAMPNGVLVMYLIRRLNEDRDNQRDVVGAVRSVAMSPTNAGVYWLTPAIGEKPPAWVWAEKSWRSPRT